MELFRITQNFSSEEKNALISQIKRSSISVCLNLGETWAKRLYAANFINKLSDCDDENSETDSSIGFAFDYQYITGEHHKEMTCINS